MWVHRRILSLSLHFNGHFSRRLAGTRMSPFWVLLELRMMEVVVTTRATRRAKLQSNRHQQQTNAQLFYRADVLPVTQPTVPKHWRVKYIEGLKLAINWSWQLTRDHSSELYTGENTSSNKELLTFHYKTNSYIVLLPYLQHLYYA